MFQSPYSPPTAEVQDAVEVPRTRPKSIQRAVACIWVSAALATIVGVLQFAGLIPTPNAAVSAATAAVSVGISALVAVKVGQGRNWARWSFVVLYVFGSLVSMLAFVVAPQVFMAISVLGKVSAVSQLALQTAALVFMFTPTSQQWFHPMR